MLTAQAIETLCKEVDYTRFQTQSIALLQREAPHLLEEWKLFCTHLNKVSDPRPEKMLLMQAAFRCLQNPIGKGELAQFLTLAKHLKSIDGLQLLYLLCDTIPAYPHLGNYLTVFQLLINLNEVPTLFQTVRKEVSFPFSLNLLQATLEKLQETYLASKYPARNIETVLANFGQQTQQLQFPLRADELALIKVDFLEIHKALVFYHKSTPADLKAEFSTHALKTSRSAQAKQKAIAILVETIRRIYHIHPYDTQIVALLGLLQAPAKLKGRIAQIKTGEGKSTIIAMLAAFMTTQRYYVDIVSSSSYLAIRDSKKYQPFFESLNLTVSHICHEDPEPQHFNALILYGTNSDFEFAMLRDGLYNTKLRQNRSFDVVIIDEADNFFLDTALNSAQMGVPNPNDILWIYPPILNFVQSKAQNTPITDELIQELRAFIKQQVLEKHYEPLAKFSDLHLKLWLESARTALYTKKENRDYKLKKIEDEITITIVDYKNTGRSHIGSQWPHIHQFLQLKHGLKITCPTYTAASVSHPAYFGLYKHLFGVTGTMGENVEREEIEAIYNVDTFDVPPHRPCLRIQEETTLVLDVKTQWEAILKKILILQKQGRPVLTLFKSISESDAFSQHLHSKSIKHQLLNDTQRESEDYLVAQAGEVGVKTVATNTAGRGTDIILSPPSKMAGGLHMIFAFYPDNYRVENQGFGRVGRQGNPGSCEMILHMQDESIQALMPWIQPGQLKTNTTLIELNRLRTNRIRTESAQRLQASQQEIVCFKQLQSFFAKMSVVYTLMENKAFEQQLIDFCSAYSEGRVVSLTEDLSFSEPYWDSLTDMASTLSDQWRPLVIQFKEIYLRHIRSLWASFYSKLRDEIEVNNREAAYQAVDPYLSNPPEQAFKTLQVVLRVAAVKRLNPRKMPFERHTAHSSRQGFSFSVVSEEHKHAATDGKEDFYYVPPVQFNFSRSPARPRLQEPQGGVLPSVQPPPAVPCNLGKQTAPPS